MPLFQPRQDIPNKSRIAATVIGFVILLLSWNLLSQEYAREGKEVLFPSPAKVWSSLADYLGYGAKTEQRIESLREKIPAGPELEQAISKARETARNDLKQLWGDIRISFIRVTVAFVLSILVGVPIGILIGSFKLFESFLQPLIEFIRYVPVPALVPLLMVMFGIDESPKIMLIFIGTVFQLMLMAADEVRRVPFELMQVSYTLGGSRFEAVRKVLMPAAMPGIFDAMRLCNGWAWSWLIVAELVAANEGMGFRIVKYQRFLQTDRIFVYLILLGIIGLLLDILFRKLNQRLFRWADTGKR